MVLIIYDINTLNIISISGYRGQVSAEETDSINLVDGLQPGLAEMRLYDHEQINKIWTSFDAKAKIEIKEREGALVVCPYNVVTISCPSNAGINEAVKITAQVEGEENKEAALYIDGEEQARDYMPAEWAVTFETQGVYQIKVDAGDYGIAEQVVVVE